MANLTGDFDVIAQFAVPAVNRILAAMHRVERFPHSISMRVDDTSAPGRNFDWPALVGVVDAFGEAASDHSSIRDPRPSDFTDMIYGGRRGAARLDGVANIEVAGVHLEPLVPSNLKGKAQAQLGPPEIEIDDSSETRLTVRIGMRSRYFPDPGTPPVAHFVRGELRMTAPVNQVASQVANVVSIDVKASSVVVNFTPHWSSSPISPEDLAGISKLIRNALRSSFLPSNAALPPGIGHMQFRTLPGSPGAVAVMLDMSGPAGNPASAGQVFLGAGDGFAFGIGADYVRSAFQPTLDKVLQQQIDPVKFDIDALVHTWHITYTVTLNSASVAIENGKIVLIFKGRANTATSWLPNFNFTVKQNITISVNGPDAALEMGSMTIDTSSTIANAFKGGAISSMTRARDRALHDSGVKAAIAKMLSADANLGGFLRSLLAPARPNAPAQPLNFNLSYSSAEIRPEGIILHGQVGVPAWAPPRVEYEPITSDGPGLGVLPGDALAGGPDYSALKTWIPGGSIERYVWHRQGTQGYNDENRFVLLDQGPVVSDGVSSRLVAGYAPLCLTVHGTRPTADGPVGTEAVSATVCGYGSFPFPGEWAVSTAGLAATIALARRGPNGRVEIVGHAAPLPSAVRNGGPNLLVHFPSEPDDNHLDALTSAVRESGRDDAATAVLIVGDAALLSRLPHSNAVTYIEDDGSWRRRCGVNPGGSATALMDPSGKIVWRSESLLDTRELSAVLNKILRKTIQSRATMLTSRVRIGQLPPNFIFEHAPGHQLTLRKTIGRPVVIVFFRQSSQASVQAVSDATSSNGSRAVVLAVTPDSDSRDDVSPAILVRDSAGRIGTAYGVSMWPTTVNVDEWGIVRKIDYGRLTAEGKPRA